MDWFKKITGSGIGTVILVSISFVLMLGGCQTTSDDTSASLLTGSWEGTLDNRPVRAIFSLDNTFHMAFLDNSGEVTGEIFTIIEKVGRGTATVRPFPAISSGNLEFGLTTRSISGRLELTPENWALELVKTSDASHSAQQTDVEGRWSLDPAGVISDLWVDQDGNLSGSDSVACNYSGTLQLLSPDWNIYQLDLEVTRKGAPVCPASGKYAGYTMVEGTGNDKTIWFSAADVGGDDYLTGKWYATKNRAPVVVVQSLPDPVAVVAGITTVTLDATGSYDENHDPLTYQWSGRAPDGSSVPISNLSSAQTSFIADLPGAYTFTLTVDDGIAKTVQAAVVNVVIAPARYTDMGNGTVRSNETNNTNGVPLIWLKDARCYVLMDNVTTGISQLGADLNAKKLADGMCGLTDGSVPGDWRLPTKEELASLVDTRFTAPSLANRLGIDQWSENDSFLNVGSPYYVYWTSTVQGGGAGYFVDFSDGKVDYADNRNTFLVWPVYDPQP